MAPTDKSDKEFDVGSRIRQLRQERDLSMRGLARTSGLSANALSMIERGLTSPSVSTVYKISHAMGLPITDIFRDQHQRIPCVHRKHGKSRRIAMPEASIEELGGEEFDGLVEPFAISLEPGANSGELPIIHTGSDFIFVLEGKVSYEIEGNSYSLEAGDSLLFAGNLPHSFHNPESVPARILIVLSGFSEGEFPGEHILYSIKTHIS
jgi:transcriptional regulator with XRE-family HTH domain